MIKTSELREKDVTSLKELLTELARERLNLRVQKAVGQSVKTHRLSEARREVARIKTVLQQMQSEKKI